MPARPPATEHVASKQASFHADVVEAVASAVAQHDVVVVGMSINPHVKRARGALDEAGIPHHDLDYGGYHSMWKERLALKMWSGWPTFPMVFVKGRLVGGANETQFLLKDGELQKLLEGERAS
jgi:glutaredoxin-related protein